MTFSTYKFIFVFFPVVFASYWLLNTLKLHSLAKICLVVASLVFYAAGSPDFFPFFLASIFGNYLFASVLSSLGEKSLERKIVLTVGVIANIALLGYYKYTDFFIENANFLFGVNFALKSIVLPIGISFFTFQFIAFIREEFNDKVSRFLDPFANNTSVIFEVFTELEDENSALLSTHQIIRGPKPIAKKSIKEAVKGVLPDIAVDELKKIIKK